MTTGLGGGKGNPNKNYLVITSGLSLGSRASWDWSQASSALLISSLCHSCLLRTERRKGVIKQNAQRFKGTPGSSVSLQQPPGAPQKSLLNACWESQQGHVSSQPRGGRETRLSAAGAQDAIASR